VTQSRNIIFGSIVTAALGALFFVWAGPPGQMGSSDGSPTTKAVIRGTIRSIDGSPLSGIRVKAKPEGKNFEVSIFTGGNGQYDFPPLPPGQYKVSVGSAWQENVTLASSGVSQDFKVQLGPAFFNQTTGDRWLKHLPGSQGEKELLSRYCGWCHSTWRAVDRPQATLEAWKELIRRMDGDAIPWGGRGQLSPIDHEVLTNYMYKTFTPDLKEKLPEGVMIRPTGEAARVVFTEWSIPPEFTSSGGAQGDSKGNIWFQLAGGTGNGRFGGVGRLDPRTGDMKTWRTTKYGFHDILLDKEDNVWLTGRGAIVKFNTKSYEFTNFDFPEKFGVQSHTIDFDHDGNGWFTINDSENARGWVVKLDTRTGATEGFSVGHESENPTRPAPYGIVVDQKGMVWFTEMRGNVLAKIDPKTGKLTEYRIPTFKSGPRRVQVDSKGRLWFTESHANKIAMFDPQTLKFSEFDLLPGGQPYFIKVDPNDRVWFNLTSGGVIGRFDPLTKQFTHFPFPVPEGKAKDAGYITTDPFSIVYGGEHAPVVGQMYVR